MNGTIELSTERLILRKEQIEDADALYIALGCDSDITKYTGWNPYYSKEAASEKISEDIENYKKAGFYSWIIQYNGEIIGTVGAYDYNPDISSIEIGYSIFKSFWGHGFASEAVSEAARYLFENEGINRISAWCHAQNAASVRVLLKAGLEQEKILKQAMKNSDGSFADKIIFSMTRDKWRR